MSSSSPIVVALSGGVDSATAAALLVEQGHQVVGITMRLWNAAGTEVATGRCCGVRDIEDARRVCETLGIPFYVVDFEDDFRQAVVDDFVDSYLRGETPNPCVRCNQSIKFTPLLRRARALGAETLVTGHYARIEERDGQWVLARGVDRAKDQSYFLFSMPTHELASIRFPLGEYSKDEVREMAQRFNLPNAAKKDSQEICFVPDGDYAGFVERAAAARGKSLPIAGDIVTRDGAVVGRHKGVHRYTIGQRRGIGDVKLADGGPAYVIELDVAGNRLVVGPRDSAPKERMQVRDLRWFGGAPASEYQTTVQVRYRAQPVPATVRWSEDTCEVEFDAGEVFAAGQAAVFYEGDAVRGGGWIA
jgi:tRNA-specific 2-thiouridylase